MTLQLGQQTITIHILANILRSKGKQAMAFSQVAEDNKITFNSAYNQNKLCNTLNY